jgi:hypothetical protein
MKTLPCATDFLSCREAYKVEYHRYCRLENMLKEALGASDAGDFERKMLVARSQKRHPAATLIELFNQQGAAFDEASSRYDIAVDTAAKQLNTSRAALLRLSALSLVHQLQREGALALETAA